MENESKRFQLAWLTSSPLMGGNWVGLILAAGPLLLALLAWLLVAGLDELQQGPIMLAGALFLSVAAIFIQAPAYMGRVELDAETLVLAANFSRRRRRRRIPRTAVQDAYYTPIRFPPAGLPFVWFLAELLLGAGTLSAAYGSGSAHWVWLTAFVLGLSFWPLMVARQQAKLQVVILYERPGRERPGVIRAWATPQHGGALVQTLLGKAAPDAEPTRPADLFSEDSSDLPPNEPLDVPPSDSPDIPAS